jgi:hypothetical protein
MGHASDMHKVMHRFVMVTTMVATGSIYIISRKIKVSVNRKNALTAHE